MDAFPEARQSIVTPYNIRRNHFYIESSSLDFSLDTKNIWFIVGNKRCNAELSYQIKLRYLINKKINFEHNDLDLKQVCK